MKEVDADDARAAPAPLVIEYVGGPRDGDLSTLLRSAPRLPVYYPLEIRVTKYDMADGTESQVGRYIRDHLSNGSGAMRYLWTHAAE